MISTAKSFYTQNRISPRAFQSSLGRGAREGALLVTNQHLPQDIIICYEIKSVPSSPLKDEKKHAQLPSFIETAIVLENTGLVDDAMDLLYSRLDKALKASQWGMIESLFTALRPGITPLNTILGVLISTYRCKDRLKLRADFVKKVRSFLVTRGEDDVAMLYGLE